MKLRNANGDFNVGLDLGTNSVGWAVTDERGQLASRGSPRGAADSLTLPRLRLPRESQGASVVAMSGAVGGSIFSRACSKKKSRRSTQTSSFA